MSLKERSKRGHFVEVRGSRRYWMGWLSGWQESAVINPVKIKPRDRKEHHLRRSSWGVKLRGGVGRARGGGGGGGMRLGWLVTWVARGRLISGYQPANPNAEGFCITKYDSISTKNSKNYRFLENVSHPMYLPSGFKLRLD